MSTSYIKRVEISKLWGKYDIVWDNLHPDVNILVGINGSGKTSLLNLINSVVNMSLFKKNSYNTEKVVISGNSIYNEYNTALTQYSYGVDDFHKCVLLSTFDVPTTKSKLRSDESPLMLELRNLILQTGANSFNDYRLKATLSSENAIEISNRINKLFELINSFFINTHKKIEIDTSNNIVFRTENNIVQLEQLSSGEKQLLLILFKVFLMDEKPYILLMDEPEISLHIGWQQNLIGTIRELNPNCQLIIATHSPSIFGKGWGDKITFMENLIKM